MREHDIGILVCILLAFAFAGTYIVKLIRDIKRKDEELNTKEIAIIGLKEIIRLLEKK